MIADVQPTPRGVHEVEFDQAGAGVSSVSTELRGVDEGRFVPMPFEL